MKAKNLIMTKVSLYDAGERIPICTRLYKKFESALSDIIYGSAELFDDLPDEWIPKNYHEPVIIGTGTDPKTGFTRDFEVHYPIAKRKWVCIYVGGVHIEDSVAKFNK